MPIPKISIEMPFGAEAPALYCPVCGTAIYDVDCEPSCSHILFSYISEVGEFDHLAPHVQEIVDSFDELPEKKQDVLDPIEAVMESLETQSAFCLEATFGGMACGPVWTTVWVGIDFNPPEHETAD